MTVPGATVGELIDALDAKHPGMRDRLVDGDRLRKGLAASVDGVLGRRSLSQPVGENSEVQFFPAIAGGEVSERGGLSWERGRDARAPRKARRDGGSYGARRTSTGFR